MNGSREALKILQEFMTETFKPVRQIQPLSLLVFSRHADAEHPATVKGELSALGAGFSGHRGLPIRCILRSRSEAAAFRASSLEGRQGISAFTGHCAYAGNGSGNRDCGSERWPSCC